MVVVITNLNKYILIERMLLQIKSRVFNAYE